MQILNWAWCAHLWSQHWETEARGSTDPTKQGLSKLTHSSAHHTLTLRPRVKLTSPSWIYKLSRHFWCRKTLNPKMRTLIHNADIIFYYVHVCVCVSICTHMPWQMCDSQGTTCKTMWFLRMGSSGVVAGHLMGPTYIIFILLHTRAFPA